MDGPQRQEEPWAAQVVLSVTGVPKAERAAIQELVERAGGRSGCHPSSQPPFLAAAAAAAPTAAACRQLWSWGAVLSMLCRAWS